MQAHRGSDTTDAVRKDFRIETDPFPHQQDSSANSGKTGQEIRKSATGCNQESDTQNSSPDKGDEP